MGSNYIGPFSLDAQTRSQIVTELRKWRFDNVSVAVRHLAYAVPQGKKFSQTDCEQILDELEFDTQFIATTLVHLTYDGVLLKKFDGALATSVYYIERRAREQYRDALKKFDKEPEPEKKEISEELKELVAKVVDPQQASFLDETMKCLSVNAPRAAIVMAWNLAYHHVRSWILARHISAFNKELTSTYRTKTKTYDPVSTHDDFPDGERLVLDISRKAGFLDKHRYDILEIALRKRNRYAHPSPASATGPEATGYVAELLKNVLLDPYFGVTPRSAAHSP